MANTKATQHEIDLTSNLNLNKFKADIKPYEGFNERNSPFYGGCLSPLYIKDGGYIRETSKYYNGHLYETNNGELFVDGDPVLAFETDSFIKKSPDTSISGTLLDYYDDENYVVRNKDNEIIISWVNQNNQRTENNFGVITYYKSNFFCDTENHIWWVLQKRGETTDTIFFNYNSSITQFNLSDTGYQFNFFTGDVLLVNKDFLQVNSFIYKKSNLSENQSATPLRIYSPASSHPGIFEPGVAISDQYLNGNTFHFRYTGHFPHKGVVGDWMWSSSFTREVTIQIDSDLKNLDEFIKLVIKKAVETEYITCYPSDSTAGKGEIKISIPFVFINQSNGEDRFYGQLFRLGIDANGYNVFSSTFTTKVNYKKSFGDGTVTFGLSDTLDGSSPTTTGIERLLVKPTGNYNFDDESAETHEMEFNNVLTTINYGSSDTVPSETDSGVIVYREDHYGQYVSYEGCTVKYAKVESSFNDNLIGYHQISISNCNKLMNKSIVTWGNSPVWSYYFRWENAGVLGDNYSNPIAEGNTVYGVYPGGVQCVYGLNKWRITANPDGVIQGISYAQSKDNIGTLLTSWGSVDGDRNIYINDNGVTYYDNDKKDWIVIQKETQSVENGITILGDYVVINTASYINCYNISTKTAVHWGSDWNNNILTTTGTPEQSFGKTIKTKDTSYVVSSAQNVNYLKDYPSSLKNYPITVFTNNENDLVTYIGNYLSPYIGDYNNVEVYLNYVYSFSFGYGTGKINESQLETTYYDFGKVKYNLPLLFDTFKSVLDVTIVGFGSNVRFSLLYDDNKLRYQYYSSSISEYSSVFIIQGQPYGVLNGKIYKATINAGVLESSDPVVMIDGLTFVGNTIYNAYFYSPTSRTIYAFGADNNLSVLAQADTITSITGSEYMPSTGSIILGTRECTYVMNERMGIFRINDIKNFYYATQVEDTIILVTSDNHSYEISYEEQLGEGWEKRSVILDTAFYGAGSNVVSVNDCWYLRITDEKHGTGEIKLAVSTLTDVGRQTETKIVKVKASDWDELTDTVYIRFQPKLQRAVGVSLHIESPFKVGYIGVGATPETLQLNRGTI